LPDSQCNTVYPSFAFPRFIAGGPLAADIIKCHLKPLDPADYKVAFSSAEWARLASIFPGGVCDWSRRGVQQRSVVPWASFGPSPYNLVSISPDRTTDYLNDARRCRGRAGRGSAARDARSVGVRA